MSFFLEQFIGRSAICILMMLWLDGLHVARTDARQSSVTSGWLTRDPYFIVTDESHRVLLPFATWYQPPS